VEGEAPNRVFTFTALEVSEVCTAAALLVVVSANWWVFLSSFRLGLLSRRWFERNNSEEDSLWLHNEG